jgi:RNA polymerase sigma factor (sigma-70 family)
MPHGPTTSVLRFLRRLVAVRADSKTTDGELLARFTTHRDEAAFAELLRRHGPMVLGVCRRVLRNVHDVDDAFQATFLVLVRKAGSLSTPEAVGNWLHGVAYRTALKARTAAVRRRQCEQDMADVPAPEASDAVLWSSLRPVLDEEIQRLPAHYRTAFVLCHLEGMTNDEAARCLGCPTGTILSRLSRARERLRARLTRRGITLSTAALGAVVMDQAAAAPVPDVLNATTLGSSLTLAVTGRVGDLVSPHVITLMEGVLQAMFMRKLKIVAAPLALVLAAGGGALGYQRLAAQPPPAQKPQDVSSRDQAPPAGRDGAGLADVQLQKKLKGLMENRLDAAKEMWRARAEELVAGRTTVDVLLTASDRVTKAQLEMATSEADRLKILETQVQRLQKVQTILEVRFNTGKENIANVAQARCERYDAEIALERFRAKLGKKAARGEVTPALFERTDFPESGLPEQ